MAANIFSSGLLLIVVALYLQWGIPGIISSANKEKQVYIVYMGAVSEGGISLASAHSDLLASVLENSSPSESLIRCYGRSFNGFAAKLTQSEMLKLSEKSSVLSVFPSKVYWPQTTRSWDYLGLSLNVARNLELESDIIVGMIDSGIWPESKSFSDENFGPAPTRWKGTCKDFPCNNKILGARFYKHNGLNTSSYSARDTMGHGSHTASTVAGVEVQNASLNHIAQGTARGAVPSARLAVYKVCWPEVGCDSVDILAAFDDAIADGVDIISISIGSSSVADQYLSDGLAIGSFHAMRNGILTSASAGNGGPSTQTVINVAPWVMTVAASTMDRKIATKLVLGNQETYEGIAINPFETEKQFRPILASKGSFGCFPPVGNDVKGKIIICHTNYAGSEPKNNGAYGQIKVVGESVDYPRSYDLPTTVVSVDEGINVREYINKTRSPVANIHKSELVFDADAPTVVSFSSRGPNLITPGILKPDIAAPGVNILAAWSPAAPLTSGYEKDYNIFSGTSMACPHATGVAAYVKSLHPTWSPAAIKSALMTTATLMTSTRNEDAEFAFGSGQLNPTKAVDPGLIYNTSVEDYVRMLCTEGFTSKEIQQLTGGKSSCPVSGKTTVRDLNYPSITYFAGNSSAFSSKFNVSFTRRVTNVGSPDSVYKVQITTNPHFTIDVNPNVMQFKLLNEEKEYIVTLSSESLPADPLLYSASITWSDGKHSVRSPVVVYHYYELLTLSH